MASASPKRNVTRADWIEAAWNQLGKAGMESIKVEVLALQLGVTKGSFYWHFSGRQELLTAVLDMWLERLGVEHMRALVAELAPAERLWQIFRLVIESSTAGQSVAIRMWAMHEPDTAAVLEQEHLQRREFIARSFTELGLSNARANDAAETYLSLLMGEYLVAGHLPLDTRIRRARRQVQLLISMQ